MKPCGGFFDEMDGLDGSRYSKQDRDGMSLCGRAGIQAARHCKPDRNQRYYAENDDTG